MTEALSETAVGILARGSYCYVGTSAPSGPHVTPMVYVYSRGRLWVTTSRGSVKARVLARDPRVSGLVAWSGAGLSFVGRARAYDALDADTWGRAVRETPSLVTAAVAFTRKNARFFAGYAVDANHVPLSWTPPGRVFVEVRIERAAVVDDDGIRERWGGWNRSLVALDRFRASRIGADPFSNLPEDVRGPLDDSGSGALAVHGSEDVVVLPARWAVDGAALYAALPEPALSLAACQTPRVPVALAVDRASRWRARQMVGAMVQGTGDVFALERLSSGGRSADARADLAGADPRGAALVRIRPARLVWWHGWASGTVGAA